MYDVINCGYSFHVEQLSLYSESLRAGGSGDRNALATRFSAPVQTDPGALPAFYTMGTGSFPARGVELTTTPSSAEVKERVGLHLCSPCVLSWPVLG
jgi:hypothetical protein